MPELRPLGGGQLSPKELFLGRVVPLSIDTATMELAVLTERD